MHSKQNIKAAIEYAHSKLEEEMLRERNRIMEKLMRDYGDKFISEGVAEYMRKREELEEMFMERWEKLTENFKELE